METDSPLQKFFKVLRYIESFNLDTFILYTKIPNVVDWFTLHNCFYKFFIYIRKVNVNVIVLKLSVYFMGVGKFR